MVRARLGRHKVKRMNRIKKTGWTLLLVSLLAALAACGETAPAAPSPTGIPATLTPAPTATTTPAPICTETRGRFEFQEIQTTLMTHPLSFRVYLPPCYDVNQDERYPVLYLLHGQSFKDDQWDRLGADEALDELIADGEARPFIIVMPRESNYMINQRTSKYGPALAEELVPWIDAHYRTQAERGKRAIGGLSRGAAWAMRTGLIYWDVFGAIGGHSLAPFRGDFNEAPFWFKKIPAGQLPRIWIDAGTRDFIADAAKVFAGRLEDYNIPFEWHTFDGSHTERYWSAHVKDYLRWYAQGWQ
jgi:Enterochelin esterase and related enzymes